MDEKKVKVIYNLKWREYLVELNHIGFSLFVSKKGFSLCTCIVDALLWQSLNMLPFLDVLVEFLLT